MRHAWYCDAALFGGSVCNSNPVDNIDVLMSLLYMMKRHSSRSGCCSAPYRFRRNTYISFVTCHGCWCLYLRLPNFIMGVCAFSKGFQVAVVFSFQSRHNLLLPATNFFYLPRPSFSCVCKVRKLCHIPSGHEDPAGVAWVCEFVFDVYCRWPLGCTDIICRYQYSDMGLPVLPALPEGQCRFLAHWLIYL